MKLLGGQYIPGDSVVHRLDARIKLLSLLALIAAIVLANAAAGYALMAIVVIAILAASKLPLRAALSPIRYMWRFFLLIFLLNALFFSADNPIWSLWIFSLSVEGVLQGTDIILRLVLIIPLGSVLTMTTSPMQLVSAIESLMSPLKLIRVPVEDIAIILSAAIQFIPTLIEEIETIRNAQIARGARFESKKLRERAMALLPLVIPVFLSAFRRADELSLAMESRGYRGGKYRTRRERAAVSGTDFVALALCLAICAAQAALL